MVEIVYGRPTRDDLPELLADLRPLDALEVDAAYGAQAPELIARGLEMGDAVAARDNTGLVAMFGVAAPTMLSTTGWIWLLGTQRADRMPRTLARQARRYSRLMLGRFRLLANYVDVRNEPSIKLLRWLGAEFSAPEPYGVSGLPFMRFELRGA